MKKFLIIAIVLFASCKPSKTIIKENTIVKYDTIHTSDVIYKTKAIRDSIIIENPCDSLGILTDFYSKFSNSKNVVDSICAFGKSANVFSALTRDKIL